MARGKEENSIIINQIFPERYSGYKWKVKYSKEVLKVRKQFSTNVDKLDKNYELLTIFENENKVSASRMIKCHKKNRWKEYFLFSPYLKIFGMKAPVIELPELKNIMEKMITVLMLADEYIVGKEDVSDYTYSALYKLTESYKNKEENDINLKYLEKKSLSEDILGFNIWEEYDEGDEDENDGEDEEKMYFRDIFPIKPSEESEDSIAWNESGHRIIDGRIKKILDDLKEEYSGVEKTCDTVIEFKNGKGNVLRIPAYLKPVIETIYCSCTKIPWMYAGKDNTINIHDKFSCNYYDLEEVTEQDWKTLNIIKRILNARHLDCFEKEGFLENYYQFVYKTLCRIKDNDKKYLVFYAMEKIYALELFELEGHKLAERLKEGYDKYLSQDWAKGQLESYLKKIFELNGAWGKLKLAGLVLDTFFENIELPEDKLSKKIDKVFKSYEEKYRSFDKGKKIFKGKLKDKIRGCRPQECMWYVERHKDALKLKNFNEWGKDYMKIEKIRDSMIFVMQASMGNSLCFELNIEGENGIWGRIR